MEKVIKEAILKQPRAKELWPHFAFRAVKMSIVCGFAEKLGGRKSLKKIS